MLKSAAVLVLRPKICRDGDGYRARVDSDAGSDAAVVGLIGPGRLPSLGAALDWLRQKLELHLRDDAAIDVGGVTFTEIEPALARVLEEVPACDQTEGNRDPEAEHW